MTQFPYQQPQKQLTRSSWDKQLGGVCGGFAQYFGIDSAMLRIFVFATIMFTGFFPGAFAYLFAWMIMPLDIDTQNGTGNYPQSHDI